VTAAALACRPRRPSAPLIILVPAVLVALAMVLPVAYLVLRALDADLQTALELIWRQRTLDLLLNTGALVAGVLTLATVISLPLAWLTTRSDIPFRRSINLLAILPLAVPGYVMAYALIGLSGNYGFLAQVFGITLPRPQGWFGATLALSLYTYPFLYLNLRSAIQGLDPSIEESARALGSSPMDVFYRITLQHLRPAFAAGWLVIGLYVLGDFGAVALMRYEAFSYAIYTQYTGAFDRVYAALLALMLISLAMVFVWWEGRLRDGRHYSRVGTGTPRQREPVRLGAWRYPALGFVAVVILAALGLPLVVMGFWLSLAPVWPAVPGLLSAFGASLSAAVPAALLAGVLALPVALLAVRYPSPLASLVDRAAFVGYAIPPLAFALAMVFLSLRSAPFLYQTLTLLVIAYALSFLALALGPIRSALYQVRPAMEETARSLGYSRLRTFLFVLVPMLRHGVLAGMILVFVIAMKELPIAFLLAPTGFQTLPVSLFSRTSEGMLIAAAPYAAAIVLFSGVFIGSVLRHETRR